MARRLFFLNTDAEIVDLIRRGDEQALVRLYESNRKAIGAFIARNNGTQDDAEDMLQEAVIALWERVARGRYEHTASLSTFIHAIVKNIWMRRLARRRRELPTEIEPDLTPDDAATPLEEMVDNEQTEKVHAALDKLGNPCRQLLLLYYWEELPMHEIALHMGFANAETVKAKKYQCKKALAELMQEMM